ncbi:interleukin-17 receptor C [Chanos chanos]|uniref:Interleukin-17 receptor C n=1 Tax=Chanos chanos TaxID=29144 RepID=A0A6J2WC50_CHACN|nr:interleukin-17 receptor C-like [Chanos chanos]
MQWFGSFCYLLSMFLHLSAGVLETIESDENHQLTCGQGLTHCVLSEGQCEDNDHVSVTSLGAHALLCRSGEEPFHPCLRIHINISIRGVDDAWSVSGDTNNEESTEETEETGESGDEVSSSHSGTCVQVSYQSPSFGGQISPSFIVSRTGQRGLLIQTWLSVLVKLRESDFGDTVVVYTSSTLIHNFSARLQLPSLEGCSLNQDVTRCKVPSLQSVIDWNMGVAKLQLDDSDKATGRRFQACKRLDREGGCRKLEWDGQEAFEISLSSVAPCLCFQVWWENGLRKEYCPFINNKDLLRTTNLSISVMEAQTNDGMIDSGRTALVWNITAPCRLEAELWLCMKGAEPDSDCQEISNERQFKNGHWYLNGEFIGVERHPSLCVQIKVKSMDAHLGPVCPFKVPRSRWSSPVLICLLLVCLSVVGVYVIHGTLKRWAFRWLNVEDIKSAIGGGHVILLYPPDADSSLAELVCRLGSVLSALGFSVSLDLWSQSELSILGPVPWLHSRLDRMQRQGGKVILVLTQAAWVRAEEWSHSGGEKGERRNEEDEEKKTERGSFASPYSDVFSASLSCILADYLQGRAGERFVLAQFEAQPAGRPQGDPLPELFRGLPLYSLPSQSLRFLTELVQGAPRLGPSGAKGRRMRAGGLRAASRALAAALRGLTGATGMCRLAGLPQDCVGLRMEDTWESVPLHPEQNTPPCSPDTASRAGTVDWV